MLADRKCLECGAAIPPGATDGLCAQCLFSLALNAPDTPVQTLPLPDFAPLLTGTTPSVGVRFHYFGDYELLEEISRGGMGIVFKARQVSLNRLVAVKLVSSGTLATEESVKRFKAEAEAAASLSHPNIVPIYEIGEHQGQHYFSMGLIEGPNLRESLRLPRPSRVGALEPAQAARLLSTITRAVHYAHQRGVLHRDIKPGNILLDSRGEPHLTDFGLAKLIEKESTLTHTNAVMGTPAYMSPEQARGDTKDVTMAADVYGLGAVLYETLTGSAPFAGGTSMETVRQVLEQEPRRPSTLNPEVDRDLEIICLKCLEKEPHRRYGSADALANELDRWLRHEPILARPITTFERVWKWVRRRPAIAALTGSLASAFILGVAGVTWQWHQARSEWHRAERERDAAQRERTVAQRERDAAQHNLYVANMNLAGPAWERNNVQGLGKLLEQTATFPDRGFEWYYWQRQLHLNHKTLHGHFGPIHSAAFSPDGQRVVTASKDSTARIWDVATGKELLIFRGHTDSLTVVAFSPDGRLVASGSEDRAVKVWEALSGKELFALSGHTAGVRAVAFSPDGHRLVTGGKGAIAKVWDVASRSELFSLTGHTADIRSVAFSSDGRRIATGSGDGTAKLWDAADGAELLSLGPHEGRVWSVAFSPQNDRLVSGDDRSVRIWAADTGAQVRKRTSHANTVYSVAFSPDGRSILSTSEDQMAILWDLSNEKISIFKGHIRPVYSAVFSPDGQQIVTAGWDQTARIWNTLSQEGPVVFRGHQKKVNSIAFSLNSDRIVTASDDQTARVWEASSAYELLLLRGHTGPVHFAAFSRDGHRIVTGGQDQTTKVWDAVTGKEVLSLGGHSQPVYSVGFSSDGQRIVTGSGDRTAKVWDTVTGTELFTLQNSGVVRSVGFSPDGRRIVTGSDDTAVRIWDATNGEKLLTIRRQAPFMKPIVRAAAFSADGERVVCAFGDWTAGVWDAVNGKEVVRLSGHNQEVYSAAFSPDGHRVVTGSTDKSARIWETASGRELFTIIPDGHPVTCVAFSPDGRRLATGTWNKEIRVWQAASKEEAESWRQGKQAEYLAAQERAPAPAQRRVTGENAVEPGTLPPETSNGPTRSREDTERLIQRLTDEGKFSEAESLAGEALAMARQSYSAARLSYSVWQLAEVFRLQNNYAEAEGLYREHLQLRRMTFAATSEEAVSAAASVGRFLSEWVWSERAGNTNRLRSSTNSPSYQRARESENLLRECLSVRRRTITNHWRLGDTQSRFGFALLVVAITDPKLSSPVRLSKIEEAQMFISGGYEALQNYGGAPSKYQRDALQRLVHLYEAWDELAPNTGKANHAAEWRMKLAEFDRAGRPASD